MAIEPAYWHWIVFGVALVLAELAITSFFILWFGIAAIVLGLLLLVVPELSLTTQVVLWTILSSAMAIAWFRILRPMSRDKTLAGLSREAIIGQTGMIIRAADEGKRGKLRFPAPILGTDEWEVIASEPLNDGERARVIDVSGNALVVTKV